MALPKGLPQVSDLNEVYDSIGAGFNAFVDENASILTASSSMPAGQLGGSGVFRSSVIGRAPITDLGNDLKVSMGVERIAVQQITQLQNEFGPNGEPVWTAINDAKGLIRYVGQWSFNLGTNPAVGGGSLNEYLEITFYGTGLNLLGLGIVARDVRASVDGGAVGSNIFGASALSGVYNNRNYYHNLVIPVVSGLTLGIHTVKLINYSAVADVPHSGFEILNESSTLKVNPGIAYIKGQKYSLTAAQSPAYNSSFESGALGTKGGRVLVYQKSDGSVAKAVTPTDASTLYLGSANHANEEIVRTHHFREFGAGRADDFSTLYTAVADKAFTLDDGTTTLVLRQGNAGYSPESLDVTAGISNYVTITFVGTGLDILCVTDSVARAFSSILVDGGSSVGSISMSSNQKPTTFKVVSGLPYGTHTVRFQNGGASSPGINRFVVYGPKKPSLPTGTVELADYNIMADYSPTTLASIGLVASGVLRKMACREFVYAGTWVFNSDGSAINNFDNQFIGNNLSTSTVASYLQYSFFGTGVEIGTYFNSGSINISVSVDSGTSYTGVLIQPGSGLSFASGNITGTNSTSGRGRIKITGLTLGFHTVKITQNGSAVALFADTVDIITPIHSPKSNLYADLQNTLTVGNCAISDNRKTSAIKEALPAQKAWAVARGVANAPTTSSPSYVPCPDMSLVLKTDKTGPVEINFFTRVEQLPSGHVVGFSIYVNGSSIAADNGIYNVTASSLYDPVSISTIVPLPAGTHKIDVYWHSALGGTVGVTTTTRTLTAKAL